MFCRGTEHSLVVCGKRGAGSRDRWVGVGREVVFCHVGVSELMFCRTWQCSRGHIGHRWRQESEGRAGGGYGRFGLLVADLASRWRWCLWSLYGDSRVV